MLISHKQARMFLTDFNDGDLTAIQSMKSVTNPKSKLYLYLESCEKMNEIMISMEEEIIPWDSNFNDIYREMIEFLFNKCKESETVHNKIILQAIIHSNIKWFWENDPILETEKNVNKLWQAFKIWCFANCEEQMPDLDRNYIQLVINNNYKTWINFIINKNKEEK